MNKESQLNLVMDQKRGEGTTITGDHDMDIYRRRKNNGQLFFVWFVLWRKFGGISRYVRPVRFGKLINVVVSSQQLNVRV